jgi:hypothetical protein
MTSFIDSDEVLDDTTDFLTAQELLFEQRLDSLGPDLVTLTQDKVKTINFSPLLFCRKMNKHDCNF